MVQTRLDPTSPWANWPLDREAIVTRLIDAPRAAAQWLAPGQQDPARPLP